MNNLTWSGNTVVNKSEKPKEESKLKKKVDYKKEISDLEKILEKLCEKYEIRPTNPVSGAIINLRSTLESLRKEAENTKFLDAKGSDN